MRREPDERLGALSACNGCKRCGGMLGRCLGLLKFS
jgi:hypothetical protein